MTFLNPLVLIGLAAAAIPLLIHLFNRRKLRTVDFSSLRFLRELQPTSLRRLKFRQILLLVVRTLLICCLVLAFARPVLRGSFGSLVGGRAGSAIALVIDDSPSMAVRNERGLLFDQVRATASMILQQGDADDRVALLPLSTADRIDLSGSLSDPSTARLALAGMPRSERSVPFVRAFRNALRLMEASERTNREIFLVTDGQASAFDLSGETPESANVVSGALRLYVIAQPSATEANAGVASVALVSRILTTGRAAELTATVHNAGPAEIRGAMVNVFLEGTRVGQHALDLPPRGKAVLPFAVIPQRRGTLQGYLQLEDDALEADNIRHFILPLNARLRVALIGSTADDTRYLAAALTLAGDTALAAGLSVDRLEPGRLATGDLDAYDVLILAGVRSYTEIEAERIAAYVKAGRGLMLFPGPSTDLPNHNTTLLRALGIPPLIDRAGLAGPVGDPDTLRSYESIGKVDFAHPLLSGLFDVTARRRGDRVPTFESPRIWKALGIGTGASGSVILQMGGGNPFLAEYPSGDGRVLVCAVDAARSWSDLPVRGIFAPLMHRSVLYLATGQRNAAYPIVGDRLTFTTRRPAGRADTRYVVRSPAGLDEPVPGRYRASTGTLMFETGPVLEAGIYTLGIPAASGGTLQSLDAVAVGIDPRETDLRPATADSLARFWKALGISADQVTYLVADEGFESVIQQSRFGTELWNVFALLALLLMAAEMALAGPWRQTATANGGRDGG